MPGIPAEKAATAVAARASQSRPVTAIRWITAFIDRPAGTFDAAVGFWRRATASSLSESRGSSGQFATLVPPSGDPYLRVQRVGGGGGTHVDFHVDDVEGAAGRAASLGAERLESEPGVATMTSPGGVVFCIVRHRGDRTRPAPITSSSGDYLLDQVCVDIPSSLFERDVIFWAELTGWDAQSYAPVHNEFARLAVPDALPLRLLLQRRIDDGPAGCHLDVASVDRDRLAVDFEQQGAAVVRHHERWIVMHDPSGHEFCLTGRDPITGRAPPSVRRQ